MKRCYRLGVNFWLLVMIEIWHLFLQYLEVCTAFCIRINMIVFKCKPYLLPKHFFVKTVNTFPRLSSYLICWDDISLAYSFLLYILKLCEVKLNKIMFWMMYLVEKEQMHVTAWNHQTSTKMNTVKNLFIQTLLKKAGENITCPSIFLGPILRCVLVIDQCL